MARSDPRPTAPVVNRPYSAYFQREVPREDEELTHVGPGTPAGEYLRRFWQPVCLSEQLKDLPLAISIMGEALVAFRDGEGRVGVLLRHCCHRGTSLEYGMVQPRGIRCCYHGWLFDVDGRILETPGEPADSKLKDALCHGAYPCLEYKGIVFTYLGAPDLMPQFPVHDVYEEPGVECVPFIHKVDNNWVQTEENNLDPVHSTFLHSRLSPHFVPTFTRVPRIDWQEVGAGAGVIYSCKRRLENDLMWVRMLHVFLPNESHVGTVWDDGTKRLYFQRALYSRWIVPVDNEHSVYVGWRHFGAQFPGGDRALCGIEKIDMEGQTARDSYEEAQRHPGDYEAQSAQRKIARHALEHLGRTDGGVALFRRTLRKAIRGQSPAALPKPAGNRPLFGKPTNLYTEDSVLRIPVGHGGKNDWDLMGEVGDRVTEIVIAGDRYEGPERIATITRQIKELERQYQ